jgi:hypothetical protein
VPGTSDPLVETEHEYFFRCVEDSNFDSGWRNEDSVAGQFAPGGSPEAPEQYWAACDTSYTFQIKVRGVECQKETDWSDIRGVVNP